MKKLILTSILTAVGLLAQSSGNGPIVQPKSNQAAIDKSFGVLRTQRHSAAIAVFRLRHYAQHAPHMDADRLLDRIIQASTED